MIRGGINKACVVLWRWAIILVALWGWVPRVGAQLNVDMLEERGRNLISTKDYLLAIHYFHQAIKAKPDRADLYYYRSLAKIYLDDYPGAEQDASKAISLHKYHTEAYRVRGFARMRLGMDSLALEDFNAGLIFLPYDRDFLYYKGAALTKLKRYEEADTAAQTLIRYHKTFYGGYSQRAAIKLEQKDTIMALDLIARSLELEKKDPFPYLIRAEINWQRKNWTSAKEDIDKAIELEPQETGLYLNRAFVRYNMDDYFGAMSDYNYAIELEPDNYAAHYNRALLRYEVMDLEGAMADFSWVLERNPDNFHARYSRAMIYMESGRNKDAIPDLRIIADQFPRFHPVYYALAQAYSQIGNNTKAIEAYNKAEDIVRRYVKDPVHNQLDRPHIAAVSNDSGLEQKEGESPEDVMKRFNQLLTVSPTETAQLSYQESIQGRVQDRTFQTKPLGEFRITPFHDQNELASSPNYFAELNRMNTSGKAPFKLYIVNEPGTLESAQIEQLFSTANAITLNLRKKRPTAADYFNRGICMWLLKDYDAARADMDSSLNLKADFTPALLARAGIYADMAQADPAVTDVSLQMAMADIDATLRLNPRLSFAWYNKAAIYYRINDYTSALGALNTAIQINPDFGQAYFNRGLVYLQLGNKDAGLSDLRRAGELGILPSYSILKRMQ